MAVITSTGASEPGPYLAFLSRVDNIGEGVSARRRAEFLFDAIALRAVGSEAPRSFEMPLLRMKTTLNRVLGQDTTGARVAGWFLIEIKRRHGGAWVWAGAEDAAADTGYSAAGDFSASRIAYLGEGGDSQAMDEGEVKKALATVRARYTFKPTRREPGFVKLQAALANATQLYVEAVDVGQASFVSVHDGRKSYLYFDVGLPLWFNQKSLPRPRPIYVPPHRHALVILSHWDFDHYSAVQKYPDFGGLRYLAPAGEMGPNAAKVAKQLGKRITLLDHGTKLTIGPMKLRWGNGTDKNNRGLLALVEIAEKRILLTGDASYVNIAPHYLAGLTGVAIPHHASGTMSSLRTVPTGNLPARAIVCAGWPNKYGHPLGKVIMDHCSSSWTVFVTGKYPTKTRGNWQF